MFRLTLLGSLAVFLAGIPLTSAADTAPAGANWPQWRGPKRDDLSPDTGLLKSWPKGGPPLLWEGKGAGRGYASVSILDGKIYTMGDGPSTAADKDEYLLCFDEATGKQLWKARLGPAWNSGQSNWQS